MMPVAADAPRATTASYLPWLAWCLVLLLAWLAYRPGLSGGFLFDDFVNLDALGAMGPVHDASSFWRYITSGSADPIGRPLSMLTFLIDASDWPAEPAPFLRTNLLIHLLNGCLLFLLLRKLGRVLTAHATLHGDAAALLGAGLWLLHPLLVSTTLYVVQREAMLPATFMLLGMLGYLLGRQRVLEGSTARGVGLMACSVVFGTLLAALCKANGVLLPLLLWTLESTVLAGVAPSTATDVGYNALSRCRRLLLVMPSVVVLIYLGHFLWLLHAPVGRPWDMAQRLLTEPRILVDYLHVLIVPRAITNGVYNDGFQVSTSLLHPWTTLPAIAIILGSGALALIGRRRAPVWSAAVLFFLGGHLLESSVVPLELYFEHRNYLPSMFLFWPLGVALAAWKSPAALRIGAGSLLLALLALITHERTAIWGQPALLTGVWAELSADSSRAQASAAIQEVEAGHARSAAMRLKPLWTKNPNDLQIALNYINAACLSGGLGAADSAALAAALRRANQGTLLVRNWLGQATEMAGSGQCPGMTLPVVRSWLTAAMANPAINNQRTAERTMTSLFAQLAMRQNQPDVALAYFNRALEANVSAETAGGQASMLANAGFYSEALAHLDHYDRLKVHENAPAPGMPWLHRQVLDMQGYWPRELALLRSKLVEQIRADESAAQQHDGASH